MTTPAKPRPTPRKRTPRGPQTNPELAVRRAELPPVPEAEPTACENPVDGGAVLCGGCSYCLMLAAEHAEREKRGEVWPFRSGEPTTVEVTMPTLPARSDDPPIYREVWNAHFGLPSAP